jgi:hypothetical protein
VNGLERCETYYHQFCLPILEAQFPAEMDRIAAGLVGEGSECFGYDDAFSEDHDFSPAGVFWLDEADFARFGQRLQQELERLPQENGAPVVPGPCGQVKKRRGVHAINAFYARFIGIDHPPQTPVEWQRIPETYLAVATNGKVFADPLGAFSSFRRQLLAYYPEDVRRKKMAARCMTMAQAGQYNFPRCLKRHEPVAAWMAAAEFIDAAISMVFLLNRRYKPFYKWMHRALADLPLLGRDVHAALTRIATGEQTVQIEAVEWVCAMIVTELQWQGLSDTNSDFLLEHVPTLQRQIESTN